MSGKSITQLKELLVYRKKDRGSVTAIATRLGQYKETTTPEWLILTDKDKMPKAEIVAFPKPPSAPGKKKVSSYLCIGVHCMVALNWY